MSIYKLSDNILKMIIEYIPNEDSYNLLSCDKYFNDKIG
jgi:hypothetical protein